MSAGQRGRAALQPGRREGSPPPSRELAEEETRRRHSSDIAIDRGTWKKPASPTACPPTTATPPPPSATLPPRRHPSQHAVGINLLWSNYYLLLVELRPSKFLPSQLGFRASAGHPDKQTDKQDEEGHIKTESSRADELTTPNKIREEGGRKGGGHPWSEKQTRVLLLSQSALRLTC